MTRALVIGAMVEIDDDHGTWHKGQITRFDVRDGALFVTIEKHDGSQVTARNPALRGD